MTASERVQSIADKVVENKILTMIARVSIAACALIGVPAGFWLVNSATSHAISLTEIKGDARHLETRVGRLEQADAQIMGRVEAGQGRLQEIDRLLGRIEERTQSLMNNIDRLGRRTDLTPPQDSVTR